METAFYFVHPLVLCHHLSVDRSCIAFYALVAIADRDDEVEVAPPRWWT
jgi:hypothetical protein